MNRLTVVSTQFMRVSELKLTYLTTNLILTRVSHFHLCFLGQTCNLTFKRTIGNSKGYNSYPRSGAIGDFNNDTQLDIAVANSGINSIGIFLAYANETFASQQT
jgi:hypothetical protein